MIISSITLAAALTVTCHLTTRIDSEKGVTRWFCRAHIRVHLHKTGSLACSTAGLAGKVPSYMQCVTDWNVVTWYVTVRDLKNFKNPKPHAFVKNTSLSQKQLKTNYQSLALIKLAWCIQKQLSEHSDCPGYEPQARLYQELWETRVNSDLKESRP